jgi:hypothetical protein
MDTNELINRFRFHPVNDVTVKMHEKARALVIDLALELNSLLPDSREKSLAMTALQESLMWANASIACNSSVQALELKHVA